MYLIGETGASESLSLCCLLPHLREGWLEHVVVLVLPPPPMCSSLSKER